MTDVATQAPTEQTDATTEQTEGEKTKRNTAPIQVTVPLDLKAQIEAKAEEAGKTSARWMLELAANTLGYELPEAAARTNRQPVLFPRTLSPEAKKERYDAATLLIAALDRGDINLAEIKARLGL